MNKDFLKCLFSTFKSCLKVEFLNFLFFLWSNKFFFNNIDVWQLRGTILSSFQLFKLSECQSFQFRFDLQGQIIFSNFIFHKHFSNKTKYNLELDNFLKFFLMNSSLQNFWGRVFYFYFFTEGAPPHQNFTP